MVLGGAGGSLAGDFIGTRRRRFSKFHNPCGLVIGSFLPGGAFAREGGRGYSEVFRERRGVIALDLLADLNEPQRQAVMHRDGPLLVLAGAGSGKTRVITRRVAYLVAQGVAPWNVLAITFTNKAASEMRQRVEQLGVPRGATVCTFHALCARLLREFATEAGLSANFTIYDRDDQIRLTRDVMGKLSLKAGNFTPAGVHGAISRAKNALQTAQEYAASADGFAERNIERVFGGYEKALGDNNALDFDDLLMRVAFLLRDRPDLRRLLAQRYRYILIDEYQDTNRAQYIIAHGIAMNHENICATGDPDQSIYAWRGADIKNILEFETDYPNATVVRLEENYRSTQPILSAASKLIACNTLRKEKALWTRREGGADVRVLLCDDEHAEADQVALRIAEYRGRGGEYSNVAVFYRVNSLSRVLERTLLRHAIPYRIARGVEFYSRKEIKDELAYLRVLANPADDLSCARIINTPTRGIGNTTISRLSEGAAGAGLSLLEACGRAAQMGLGKAPTKKVSEFAKMMAELAGRLDRPVRQIVEDVVARTGLEESLRGEDEDGSAYENVGELISAAAEFDQENPEGTLADYLQQVSLVSDADHMDGSAGAVTLMTLHAAKGLEFPAVFVIGCEEGLLPFDRGDNQMARFRRGANPELEEERRLAFVGMTRAQDELTLTCARRRMLRGRTSPQAASTFLDEIGGENISREDLTTPSFAGGAMGRGFGESASGPRGGFYADVDERALIEAVENEHPYPPEYEHLREGSMVRHPKFGLGKILKLAQPWPETRATIHFQQCGPKKIVLAMTTLELVEEI